jgi:transposase-like protein
MENRGIKCRNCGSEKGQHKKGFTGSGSQRMFCNICKCKYTPKPKNKAYSEEVRKQALWLLVLGNTGRGVGKALNMSKANAYRWAREEVKKTPRTVDKSSDEFGGV